MGSDSGIILYIFAFYIFLFFILGLVGGFVVKSISTPAGEDLGVDPFDYILFFFEGIGYSIVELGIFNVVLFAPLGITLLYLLAKLLRGGG
jgi:ABC-type Fe3+ transport system permease subunit